MIRTAIPVIALAGAIGACAPTEPLEETSASKAEAPAPDPADRPASVVKPRPQPAVDIRSDAWEGADPTPGRWTYRDDARGSVALFGTPQSDASFVIRCEEPDSKIYLSRAGDVPGATQMTLRASSGMEGYALSPTGGELPYMASEVVPTDPMLDRVASSRGFFLVAVTGLPPLKLPAWPEFTRVVEDCRG